MDEVTDEEFDALKIYIKEKLGYDYHLVERAASSEIASLAKQALEYRVEHEAAEAKRKAAAEAAAKKRAEKAKKKKEEQAKQAELEERAVYEALKKRFGE